MDEKPGSSAADAEVKGRVAGYSDKRSCFLYLYTCQRCGKEFEDTAMTTLCPVNCHSCQTGTRYSGGSTNYNRCL